LIKYINHSEKLIADGETQILKELNIDADEVFKESIICFLENGLEK